MSTSPTTTRAGKPRMQWSERLDRILRELYPHEQASAIAARIGGACTAEAIHARAARLGVRKNGPRELDGAISTRLRALLREAGAAGLDSAHAATALQRISASQAASSLQAMARRGHIAVLRVAHGRTRYFATQEQAAAWLRSYHAPLTDRQRRAFVGDGPNAHTGLVRRAWWPADAPMHITPTTKFTVCPGFTGNPTRTNTHASST